MLVETKERTHMWAWKHPHQADGTVTYTRLTGDVRMMDVDFGYEKNKIVLHNITLYAEPGQKVAFVGATGAGKTTVFMISLTVRSDMTGSTSIRSKNPICAGPSALSFKTPICLPARCWTTSVTAVWMLRMRIVSRPPNGWARMILYPGCLRATIPC